MTATGDFLWLDDLAVALSVPFSFLLPLAGQYEEHLARKNPVPITSKPKHWFSFGVPDPNRLTQKGQ